MRSSLAVLALAGSVAAQGVTDTVAPTDSAPQGCEVTREGTFGIQVVNATTDATAGGAQQSASSAPAAPSTPARLRARQAQESIPLQITLNNGVLKDDKGRTGYIAANYQFQFDSPPQEGSIYTGGFSVCANGSLALGGSAVFYQCSSGDFFNLYDRNWAPQCVPAYFVATGGSSSTSTGNSSAAGASTNGTTQQTGAQTPPSQSPSGSTGSTGSTGTSGSETQQEAPAPAIAGAAQILPSVLSVLSLAVVVAFQL